MITFEQVQRVTRNADLWFVPLRDAMVLNDVDTDQRINHFLAQAWHESNGFRRMFENLKYSKIGLMNTFPGKFTPEEAVEMAFDEERIANRVYHGRYGNGSEASGDGYRYRGRGLVMLTFKDNYAAACNCVGIDLVSMPDRAAEPHNAAMIMGWYWSSRDCNSAADADDVEAITKKINGGVNGLRDRVAALDQIERMMA